MALLKIFQISINFELNAIKNELLSVIKSKTKPNPDRNRKPKSKFEIRQSLIFSTLILKRSKKL